VGVKRDASSNYAMDISGKMRISGGNWVDLIIEGQSFSGHNLTVLRPSTAWGGGLGTESEYFAFGYIQKMYSLNQFSENMM